MYIVEFAPRAEKDFRKLPRTVQLALKDKIDDLAVNPRGVNAKKLQGGFEIYRLRVGNYRVVYAIQNKKLIVLILRVAHRKEIYKLI